MIVVLGGLAALDLFATTPGAKGYLEIIKLYLDIFKVAFDMVALLVAGLFVIIITYGIALRWSAPKRYVDHLFYWVEPEHTLGANRLISVQIRLVNPQMGSQVATETEFKDLTVEQTRDGVIHTCVLYPQTFLEPFPAKEQKDDFKPLKLYSPPVMMGAGDVTLHLAYIPYGKYTLHLESGDVTFRFDFLHKLHSPLDPLKRLVNEIPLLKRYLRFDVPVAVVDSFNLSAEILPWQLKKPEKCFLNLKKYAPEA